MVGEPLALPGCGPTALASYLKAVGVLRLISSPTSHVSGRAANPRARGWWENECFHLRTTLDGDGLRRFFLHDYAPSPIIAPWNGGSGFYPKDKKDGFEPLATTEVAPRFFQISSAIRLGKARLESNEKPSAKAAKVGLVARLRAELPDPAIPWMDAVLALSDEDLAFPALLGTGGNDGRLEFTNNFQRRLVSRGKPRGLFDAQTGEPSNDAAALLASALLSTPAPALHDASAGQFAPAAHGRVNPWDFVLMLEGATAFAGAATRRHQGTAGSQGASFPFTVRPIGAGSGGVGTADENLARSEFWAPLWKRPARYSEIAALFGEGRAVLNGRTAKDGLEFARAAGSLGVSRGFREFERFGFLPRAGRMYIAAPIGRRSAARSPGAGLVANLDAGGWLDRIRRIGRSKEEPTAARRAIGLFEDALFELVSTSGGPAEMDRAPVQKALVALGQVVAWLAVSPSGRKAVGAPPPLQSDWLRGADDRTPELRVAAALAGIGSPAPADPQPATGAPEAGDPAGSSAGLPAPSRTQPTASLSKSGPPMAAHFAPLDETAFFARRAWSEKSTPPTVVWGAGSLVSNLIAVLERRLVEAAIRGLDDKPLASGTFARLADVAAFLAGDFDDARCAALLAGLVWTRPTRLPRGQDRATRPAPVPFAYAALKPVLSPDASLHAIAALPPATRLPVPPGLIARLRAGGPARDGRATNEAVMTGFARARASGLPSPFGTAGPRAPTGRDGCIGAGLPADRLAAALLIPVGDRGLASLIRRAYPGAPPEPDDSPRRT